MGVKIGLVKFWALLCIGEKEVKCTPLSGVHDVAKLRFKDEHKPLFLEIWGELVLISTLELEPSFDEAIIEPISIIYECFWSLFIPEMVAKDRSLSEIPKFTKELFKRSCQLSNKLQRTSNPLIGLARLFLWRISVLKSQVLSLKPLNLPPCSRALQQDKIPKPLDFLIPIFQGLIFSLVTLGLFLLPAVPPRFLRNSWRPSLSIV